MEKKLFLLDSYALIYRAYYSFANNHRYNSKGQNTSTQYGFTNTLLEVINKEQPTHIAAVFDSPAAVDSREAIFADYKANREEMPEDIRKALPDVEKILHAFNIPVLKLDGYEADDIVGTLSRKAEKEGFKTYMMTPDKDFGQLVTDNVYIFKPGRFGKPAETWGIAEVCNKFEIEQPSQVIDILGLWGDAVDNIPGIPGVGEKTAKKLIKEYGSVEAVIEHAENIKGKLGERIRENSEMAKISKQLATIILDVPVDFNAKELELDPPNKELLKEIFAELEFRSLSKRVLGESIQASAQQGQLSMFDNNNDDDADSTIIESTETFGEFKTIENTTHEYFLVNDKKIQDQLIKELKNCTSLCFDTETTSLDQIEAELVGISISTEPHKAYYVPIESEKDPLLTILKPFLEDPKKEKIAQNLKYDLSVLKKYNIDVSGPLFDTMIAHYLLRPDMKHNMDLLAESYLSYRPVSIEELIGKKGKNQLNMKDVAVEKVSDYAAEDADITLQLKNIFEPQLKENNVEKLFHEIEMPLVKVLAKMELEGINVDKESLHTYSKELEEKLLFLEKDIKEIAGVDFNVDSPRQLGEVLFENLKIIEKPKKTKSGQYATSEDILLKLKDKHPIIEKILSYRMLRKLKNTYVDPLPTMVNKSTNRIHTSFMQTIAATGRLSSNNPNLQNIPIKTEEGRYVRKAFIPKNNDYTLLAADYSQIELRIIAALSKDENMINAFKNKEDIHSSTAAKIFGVNQKEVSREMRIKAKAVNFGIIYGQTPFGLSKSIDISRSEAAEIIENYFKQYPKVSQYIVDIQELAKKQGYVETILGRRRYLKDINSNNAIVRGHAERNAINAPIQGSAADIIKLAMINIDKRLSEKNYNSKLLLQVHDELVFDVHKKELDDIKTIVKHEMENAISIDVPLEVEIGLGGNWLDAH